MEEDADKARAGMNELELSCFSLGNMDCGFVARGKNSDETAAKMLGHFKQAHSDKLLIMNDEQRKVLEQKMKEFVH